MRFEQMPSVLKLLKGNYANVIQKTANSVKTRLGVKTGLDFLITTVENYPDRFQYTYDSVWRRHASTLGEWRWKVEETQALGSLSPRLLAIVIKELKRDMRMGSSQSRYIYHSRYIYGRSGYRKFWTAKKSHFKRAAEEVLEEQNGSTRAAIHVAQYLHGDLGYKKRAIEIMAIQHAAEKLNALQQTVLVKWLQDEGRHGRNDFDSGNRWSRSSRIPFPTACC